MATLKRKNLLSVTILLHSLSKAVLTEKNLLPTESNIVAPYKKGDKYQYLQLRVIYLKYNPIALRMAKTLWSFGRSECNRVNHTMTLYSLCQPYKNNTTCIFVKALHLELLYK